MNTRQNNLARSRWSLLQEAITKKRIPEPKDNPASKRVFEKFSDIVSWTSDSLTGKISVEIKVEKHDNNKIASYQSSKFANNINSTSSTSKSSTFQLTVFRNSQCSTVDIDDLRGYDKTGRICIWPAEQVLAYWCLKNSHLFEGKVVIEIGGGFHCLAGVAIAKYIKAKEVVLTDGDPANVEEIRKTLYHNTFTTKLVTASLLHWDGYASSNLEGRFDQVIAADVVYDSGVFDSLIKTVSKLLKTGGQFILFNPTRVAKLVDLIEAAKRSKLFQEIKVSEDFDNHLSSLVEVLKKSDMADYWKSMDKKYCEVCKCWLTDNSASIAFHENGNRHKMNIQNRLREIHKKNKTDLKSEKKFEKEMRKIEQAALAASTKDMEENPDVSMKIQTYINMVKESESPGTSTTEESPSTSKKSGQPTILHRSDKQKKADATSIENMNKSAKSYQRLGGWDVPQTSGSKNFLELPTKHKMSPGASLHLDAKLRDEEPVKFGVKTVECVEPSTSVKSEGGEVAFKKRKLNKGTVRRRGEDDN